jgi:hypothetical protein
VISDVHPVKEFSSILLVSVRPKRVVGYGLCKFVVDRFDQEALKVFLYLLSVFHIRSSLLLLEVEERLVVRLFRDAADVV